MITSEIHTSFRPGEMWQERFHLPRLEPGVGAARPFVFVPIDRRAAFVMLAEGRENPLHLRNGEIHAFTGCHCPQSPRALSGYISLQHAALAGEVMRLVVCRHDWQVGCRRARKPFVKPEPFACLLVAFGGESPAKPPHVSALRRESRRSDNPPRMSVGYPPANR